MGMYESPIKIIYWQMQTQMEGDILKAVMRTDIQVDKEELLRALQYDRAQYERGFAAGYMNAQQELVRCKDCKHYMTFHCTCDGCCISDNWYCADGERTDNDCT